MTPKSQQRLISCSHKVHCKCSWVQGSWLPCHGQVQDNYCFVNTCFQAQHGRGQVRLADQTLASKCSLLATHVTSARTLLARAIHMAMPNIKEESYICVHGCVCVYTYICYFFLHFSRNRGEMGISEQ